MDVNPLWGLRLKRRIGMIELVIVAKM